jgi:D-specific alpha-keto acid dehydrogenase
MRHGIGITVFGCERDEAAAFHRLSPRYGVRPTVVRDALSEANAGLTAGNQCVSVGHKSAVAEPALAALKRAGARYISARSVGVDHIDTAAAAKLGIGVGNVAYSPDSVADYTLMLMLMAVRGAKAIIRSVEKCDYRLNSGRGQELRDLTVGVVGAGRIGQAVLERLGSFGCRLLVSDHGRRAAAGRDALD